MPVEETIKKVQQAGKTRGKLYQLHKDLNLPYSWLAKLAAGEIKEPGASRIEKLAKYFQQDKAA